MPRRSSIFTLMILAAAPISACAADLSTQQAIDILLDPHTTSPLKLDACNALRDYRGPDRGGVLYALLRQARYDMPPVRERAAEVLKGLVGESELRYLRDPLRLATTLGPIERLVSSSDWLASIHDWTDLPAVRYALISDTSYARDAAARAVLRIWSATHAFPDERQRADLSDIQDTLLDSFWDLFPRLTTDERTSAIQFALALNPKNPRARLLVVQALSDDDEKVRALAQSAADRLPARTAQAADPFVIERLVQTVLRKEDAPKSAAVAEKYIDAMGAEAKSMAVRLALYYLARGDQRAEQYLPRTTDAQRSLIDAAKFVANTKDTSIRARLRDVFKAFAQNPQDARRILVRALVEPDCRLATLAATLAATSKETFDPPGLLDAAILALPEDANLADAHFCPAAVTALRLDPVATCTRMIPHLREAVPARRLAALRILKSTGLVGPNIRPEIRPLIESLLDDPRDAIRYTAADVLGRTDILARAAIPELLVELSHDDPARRASAARRLDALAVEPKEITAALVRATQDRNMPVRQGVILAIQQAYQSRQNSLQVLRQLAADDHDPTTRAYARAALREITIK
jgi:hypothetical protein